MPPAPTAPGPAATVHRWCVALLAGVVGAVMVTGGTWLFVLGGSVTYILAGLGLLVTAWLLAERRLATLWVYVAVFVFTGGWAVWEKGDNLWAQVARQPRVGAEIAVADRPRETPVGDQVIVWALP